MASVKSPHLYSLVVQAAEKNGSMTALAKLIGISISALTRGAKSGLISTDTLLGVAEHGGIDPTILLAAAGKGDTAKRIARLYGKQKTILSADERALLDLDDETKRQMVRLIDGLTK
jgi:hypothetical protein